MLWNKLWRIIELVFVFIFFCRKANVQVSKCRKMGTPSLAYIIICKRKRLDRHRLVCHMGTTTCVVKVLEVFTNTIVASEAFVCEKITATKCYASEYWTRDLCHLDLMQGGHGKGKTGNLVLTFSRQGKHREFCFNTGKVLETRGKYFWLYLLMQKACFSLHIFKNF